ncbi:MAG: hypothetical protein ACLSWS_18925, partial [Faecalispora jeddahensis]
ESLYKDKATLEIMDLCMDAATALSTIQAENKRLKSLLGESGQDLWSKENQRADRLEAENEKLRAELEQKEKYYEQMVDALAATESAELEQVKRERRIIPKGYALVKLKLLEELDNFRELGPIDRLRKLKQADDEGRCVVFQPGYAVVSIYNPADEDGLYTMKVTGVITKEEYEAALRREQDD